MGPIAGTALTINSGTVRNPPNGFAISMAGAPVGIVPGMYITTGTTSAATLAVGATAGPEALQLIQQSCAVPAIIAGNKDLSGAYSSAAVNAWTINIAGSGC